MAPFTDLSSKRLAPHYRRGHPQPLLKLPGMPPEHDASGRRDEIAAGSRIVLTCVRRNFFQSRGFPATLPTPRHAHRSNSGNSCAEPMKHSTQVGDFAAGLRLCRHQPCLRRRLHRAFAPGFLAMQPHWVDSCPEASPFQCTFQGVFSLARVAFPSWRGRAKGPVNARQIAPYRCFDR
jgi:hypothetical protein